MNMDIHALGSLRNQPITAQLRHALRHDEFHLAYQPIVDLNTRQWLGAEALIRWSGRQIGPDIFIPIAEQVGIIRDITQRVCALAAQDRPKLSNDPDFRLSINLSAADIESEQTIEMLGALLARSGAPATSVLVEATERSFLNPARCASVIRAIRAMGVRIVIDDFGTGYSNLQCLGTFELDGLKIDRTLVNGIGRKASNDTIIRHIVKLGDALGLSIVAEGVETPEQACFLRDHGVRLAQGWLFARAMPIDALASGIADGLGGFPAQEPQGPGRSAS